MLTLIIITTFLIFFFFFFFLKAIFYRLPRLTLEIEGSIDYKALDEFAYPNLACIYKKLEKLNNIEKFSQESEKFPAFGTGKMIKILGNSEKAYNLLANLSKRLHEDDLYIFEHYILDKIDCL
jgi:hypothetical protein